MPYQQMDRAVEGAVGSSEDLNVLVDNVDFLHQRVQEEKAQNDTQDQKIGNANDFHASFEQQVASLKSQTTFPGAYGGEWISSPPYDTIGAGTTDFAQWNTEIRNAGGVTLESDGKLFTVGVGGLWMIDCSIEFGFQNAFLALFLARGSGLCLQKQESPGAQACALRVTSRFQTGEQFKMQLYTTEQENIRNAEVPPGIRAYWVGE